MDHKNQAHIYSKAEIDGGLGGFTRGKSNIFLLSIHLMILFLNEK